MSHLASIGSISTLLGRKDWGNAWRLAAEREVAAGPEQQSPRGPHAHLTIDQIQARYSELHDQIEAASEEQHRICEELMSRVDIVIDQSKVDWFVVAEAVRDACDEELGGPKDYQRQFQKAGLLVVHQDDLTPMPPATARKEME